MGQGVDIYSGAPTFPFGLCYIPKSSLCMETEVLAIT